MKCNLNKVRLNFKGSVSLKLAFPPQITPNQLSSLVLSFTQSSSKKSGKHHNPSLSLFPSYSLSFPSELWALYSFIDNN